MQSITYTEARLRFGMTYSGEVMPNGETRHRLTPKDGNGYIRTEASEGGAWQVAHVHKSLAETYVVERGWIASAEWLDNKISINRHSPGEVFTTRANVPHNIYMSGGSIIHTVKHGGKIAKDWEKDEWLTQATKSIAEWQLFDMDSGAKKSPTPGEYFKSYVDLYNNLDNLLWSIPNLLAAGGTALIGFLVAISTRNDSARVPSPIFAAVFLFSSILFYLGYVSMTRLREHHTMVGSEIAKMDGIGYFHNRLATVKRKWPVAAPNQFRVVYLLLSILTLSIGTIYIIDSSLLDGVVAPMQASTNPPPNSGGHIVQPQMSPSRREP